MYREFHDDNPRPPNVPLTAHMGRLSDILSGQVSSSYPLAPPPTHFPRIGSPISPNEATQVCTRHGLAPGDVQLPVRWQSLTTPRGLNDVTWLQSRTPPLLLAYSKVSCFINNDFSFNCVGKIQVDGFGWKLMKIGMYEIEGSPIAK